MPCLTVRTKGLREFKQELVSYRGEFKRTLIYKQIQFGIMNCGKNMTARE